MVNFDFIGHDGFRNSIESDYNEMILSLEHKAYKAVYVLAGSIIEALLMDCLIVDGYGKPQAVKLKFVELINECKKRNIIEEREVNLSTILRNQRNLIHAGRLEKVREGEDAIESIIDEDGATVVCSLVRMVINRISLQRKKVYPYTSTEIIDKIKSDPDIYELLSHILKKTNPTEFNKLLNLIPTEYDHFLSSLNEAYHESRNAIYYEDNYAYLHDSDDAHNDEINEYKRRFRFCYRTIFDKVDDKIKKQIVYKFAHLVKIGSPSDRLDYETVFFKIDDIKYLDVKDKDLVKKYIIRRLYSLVYYNPNIVNGIGHFLEEDDINSFITILFFLNSDSTVASRFIATEYSNMESKAQLKIKKLLEDFFHLYQDESNYDFAQAAKQTLELIEEENIPF